MFVFANIGEIGCSLKEDSFKSFDTHHNHVSVHVAVHVAMLLCRVDVCGSCKL